MKQLTINHLAVGACFVLLTILGFLWYSPALFGNQWMTMVGLDAATIEANPPGASVWVTNTIATIIPLYVLAWLFVQLKVETAMRGAMIGLILGFAFIHLSDMTGNMFAGRPYGLAWITGGYSMVAMALSGLILGAWRKYTE